MLVQNRNELRRKKLQLTRRGGTRDWTAISGESNRKPESPLGVCRGRGGGLYAETKFGETTRGGASGKIREGALERGDQSETK